MSGAVQAGYAPPTRPDQPAPGRRGLRWLVAAAAAWAVLLAGLTWWSVRHDPPTVKEQRSLGQAIPVVDGAVGRLVAAVDGEAWELTPAQLRRGCRVTPLADGATLTRGLDVLVAVGSERALLERVAQRLPADWWAGVGAASGGPRLRADAGEFVAVDGRVVADGRVRLSAATGCRPVDPAYAEPRPAPAVAPELGAALRALGRSGPPPAEVVVAPCPAGGTARTVSAAAGGKPVSLAPLRPLGVAVVDRPETYAYRAGPVAVLADATGDQLRLAASTGCAG
ncbi:hypothetical protein ONA91_00655 [Micromonospora sp. DR5-3]|uniref:hypothetical protein n=1 Tax=unclassified Micromonospora TaxID=2617518 RepID=UPI0011D7FF1B|nr:MULTISPECIES: hypothetical protein [unclassified Micromonospora]MCW3812968.1 hypothetical protein [Micromonospora sp. DR5-3]TYC26033.1 hypothetical protein FXF52_01310 [Micromonospora sp. MP36]